MSKPRQHHHVVTIPEAFPLKGILLGVLLGFALWVLIFRLGA